MPGGTRRWSWKFQVPEVSTILGRAHIVGLEKAVEVLDTLGSNMSNLNSGNGFVSGTVHRGNKISILAFEVANTIAKGSTLLRSLSEENLLFLKKEILQSDGVQQLVSTDIRELLSIVAADKREEFVVFFKEVERFGNLCKDPQWHHLVRCFQNLEWNSKTKQQLKEAETIIQHLVNLAQHTSELYHELQALDRSEQDFRRELQEEESLPTVQRGENLLILRRELKHQRKLVRNLKKKSLWSRNLEEVVEKLLVIVTFLHKEIFEAFGQTGINVINCKPDHAPQRLGALGLAFHYANAIGQIDNIASRPISLPPSARNTLYDGLPVAVKSALRSRLQSFHVKDEFTVALIESEMQKILQWLRPMADNTIVHQGFGWVGEWANMSTELNNWPAQHYNVIRIQTLHHADKEKTEAYILDLVVWLHHLASHYGFKIAQSIRYPSQKNTPLSLDTQQDLPLAFRDKKPIVIQLSEEDRKMLECVSSKGLVLRRSKSHGCITKEKKGRSGVRSSGNSPSRGSTGLEFCIERRRVLDVIDRVDALEPPFAISSFYA